MPFRPLTLPILPPQPTAEDLRAYTDAVQVLDVQQKITDSSNEETGPVDVLSLCLSAFFVLCSAEWMAEVEADLIEAERYDNDAAYPYINGIKDLSPATVFHATCVVLAFVASFGLTIGLLSYSDQQVLDTVVWPGLTLRLMFFLSEILQVAMAFVFAKTIFKHGLNPLKVVPVGVVLFLAMCTGWIPLLSDDHGTIGTRAQQHKCFVACLLFPCAFVLH